MKQKEMYYEAVSRCKRICNVKKPNMRELHRFFTICGSLMLIEGLDDAEFSVDIDSASGRAAVEVTSLCISLCGEGLHRFASAVANCDELTLRCAEDHVAARFTVGGVVSVTA